jgi:hypothetical protein
MKRSTVALVLATLASCSCLLMSSVSSAAPTDKPTPTAKPTPGGTREARVHEAQRRTGADEARAAAQGLLNNAS